MNDELVKDDNAESRDVEETSNSVPVGPVEVASFGAKQALSASMLTGRAGFDYLRFLLNPDIEQPVRMPSGYSFPTAIVSAKTNVTMTIGSQGDFCGYFAPQNIFLHADQGNACSDYVLVSRNVTTQFSTQSWRYLMTNATNFPRSTGIMVFPYVNDFSSVRVIGAVMEIVYMGALQNTSGSYIVSANIIGVNSRAQGYGFPTVDTPGVPGVNSPPTINQQFNERICKKYMGGDLIRMVWFPVDYSCAQFRQSNVYTTNVGGLGSFSQLVFYINGYGFPANAQFDVRVQTFYEAVPSRSSGGKFVGMQAGYCDDWKEQWNELNKIARGDLGRLLLSGVRQSN